VEVAVGEVVEVMVVVAAAEAVVDTVAGVLTTRLVGTVASNATSVVRLDTHNGIVRRETVVTSATELVTLPEIVRRMMTKIAITVGNQDISPEIARRVVQMEVVDVAGVVVVVAAASTAVNLDILRGSARSPVTEVAMRSRVMRTRPRLPSH